MERGEGGYRPDIELVDKQPKSVESAAKYAGGDKVKFKEWRKGRHTGRVVDGVVVGVDNDGLRIMEALPGQEDGPISAVAIENVIGKRESNGDTGQKDAA